MLPTKSSSGPGAGNVWLSCDMSGFYSFCQLLRIFFILWTRSRFSLCFVIAPWLLRFRSTICRRVRALNRWIRTVFWWVRILCWGAGYCTFHEIRGIYDDVFQKCWVIECFAPAQRGARSSRSRRGAHRSNLFEDFDKSSYGGRFGTGQFMTSN